MTRVALDLLGGDRAPEVVVDGALLVAAEQPEVDLVLVGPPEVAGRLLADRGAPDRFEVVAASEVVGMDEEPAKAVRAKRDATVRVAARLIRDGAADAMVSIGSTGATLAAAVFTLGRLKGLSRPPLAAVVPARTGPVVLLDVGATTEATPEMLAQFALAGAAFATVRLGLPEPRVGLLSIGEEPGKGDELRRAAYSSISAALDGLPVDFVGNVEGRDVPYGGRADVIVTDGFTGNVLAKGLEGAASMLADVLRGALEASGDERAGLLTDVLAEVLGPMSPEALGGAVLLGVKGVVVVGHGASTPQGVASCVRTAAAAAREGLVPRVGAALANLLERTAQTPGPGAKVAT